MDKVQKTISSQCYIPSSEPFRIHYVRLIHICLFLFDTIYTTAMRLKLILCKDCKVKCLAAMAVRFHFEINASFSTISMQTGCYGTGV
jgi:hypothetical protein